MFNIVSIIKKRLACDMAIPRELNEAKLKSALHAIAKNPLNIRLLDPAYVTQEVALAAVSMNGALLRELSDDWKNDREVVKRAIQSFALAIRFAGKALKDDKKLGLEAVKRDGQALAELSDTLKNDYDVVRQAVLNDGMALKHASDNLKKDKEIAADAIDENKYALHFVDDAIREDPEIRQLDEFGMVIYQSGDKFRNDKALAIEAVKRNGLALAYFSDAIRNDEEVVRYAVIENGYALEYAGEIPKNNEEIVYIAIEKDPKLLQFAGEGPRGKKEIVKFAMSSDPAVYRFACSPASKDKAFAIDAICKNPNLKDYMDEDFVKNLDFEAAAGYKIDDYKTTYDWKCAKIPSVDTSKHQSEVHKQNCQRLKDLDKEIKDRSDKAQLLLAVTRNEIAVELMPKDVEWMPKKYAESKEFVERILERDGELLADFPKFQDDSDMVAVALDNNVKALQFASDRLRDDKKWILQRARKQPEIVQYASENLRKDSEFWEAAINENLNTYAFLPEGIAINKNPKYSKEDILTGIAYDEKIFTYAEDTDVSFCLEAVKANNKVVSCFTPHQFGNVMLLVAKNRFEQLKTNVLPGLKMSFINAITEKQQEDKGHPQRYTDNASEVSNGDIDPTYYWKHSSEFNKLPPHWKKDEAIVKAYLSVNPHIWTFLPTVMQKNEEIKRFSIKMNQQYFYREYPMCLQHANPGIWEDLGFVEEMIWECPECLDWAPNDISINEPLHQLAISRKSKELISAYKNKQKYYFITKEEKVKAATTVEVLAKQKEVLLKAISGERNWRDRIYSNDKECAAYLTCAPDNLLNDADFMSKAIGCNPYAYLHRGPSLKFDKELAKQAIVKMPRFYQEMPVELQHDLEMAIAATKRYLFSAMMIPACIRDNKDFALAFVSERPKIDVLSRALRADREVVSALLTSKSENACPNFVFADTRFFFDREFVQMAINGCGDMLQVVNPKFREDKDLVMLAVQRDPQAIRFASADLQKDTDVLKMAIKGNPDVLNDLSEDIQKSAEVKEMLEIRQNPDHTDFRDTNKFALGLFFFGSDLLTIKQPTDEEALTLIRKDPERYLEFFDEYLRSNHELRDSVATEFSGAYKEMRVKAMGAVKKEDLEPALGKEVVDLFTDGWQEKEVKDLHIELIQKDAAWLEVLPESYGQDLDFVLGLLKNQERAFRYASQTLRSNPDTVTLAVAVRPAAICAASDTILDDLDFLKSLASKYPNLLRFLPEDKLKPLMDNEPELLLALYSNTDPKECLQMFELTLNAWSVLPAHIKKDRDFLKQLLIMYSELLNKNVDESFRTDREFLLGLLEAQVGIWPHIDESIRSDTAFILEAVGKNSSILEQVTDQLNDRGFVKKLAGINWKAVEKASPELLSDKAFLKELIDIAPKIVLLAHESIKENVKVFQGLIWKAIKKDHSVVKDVDRSILNENDFLIKFLVKYPELFAQLDDDHPLIDEKFMRNLVKNNVKALAHAPEKWRANESVANKAIEINREAIKYLSEDLKRNRVFIQKKLSEDGLLLAQLPHLKEDFDLVKIAIEQNPEAYCSASDAFKRNKLLAELAVTNNPALLEHVPDDCNEYIEVVVAAAKVDIESFEKVPEVKRKNIGFMIKVTNEVPEAIKYMEQSRLNNKPFMAKLTEKNPALSQYLTQSKETGDASAETKEGSSKAAPEKSDSKTQLQPKKKKGKKGKKGK